MSTPEQPLDPTKRYNLEPERGGLDLVGQAVSSANMPGQAKPPGPPDSPSSPSEFWRSLEQRAARPDFGEWLEKEYPRQATAWSDIDSGVNRRLLHTLLGGS